MATLVVQWCGELEDGASHTNRTAPEDEAYFLRVPNTYSLSPLQTSLFIWYGRTPNGAEKIWLWQGREEMVDAYPTLPQYDQCNNSGTRYPVTLRASRLEANWRSL